MPKASSPERSEGETRTSKNWVSPNTAAQGWIEPRRVCRRLHVWMPRFMQERIHVFGHVTGCGHVSGL
jgi:hypothetical protein